jgi:colicin import membrane protein
VQFGLAISLLLHTGLLAWAYLVMLSTPKLEPPEPEPITVALITPSELLRLKQGSETAKELEAKAKEEPSPAVSKQEAEKPKPVEAPTPPEEPKPPVEEAKPAPPEAAKPNEPPPPEPPKADPIADKLAALPPEPAPGPSPEELKKLEDDKKVEEEKKAEEKRKIEAKKKSDELKKRIEQRKKSAEAKKMADAAKKSTTADRLAALLDKDPAKKGAPQSALPPTKDTTYTGPTAGARQGTDTVLSAREQDLLRGQISAQLRGCWQLPGGGGGIETTVVTLKWHLTSDGSLDGEPATQEPQSDPVYQIAAEAAIRAVKKCTPFSLPPEMYTSWKTIIWEFDPREML